MVGSCALHTVIKAVLFTAPDVAATDDDGDLDYAKLST